MYNIYSTSVDSGVVLSSYSPFSAVLLAVFAIHFFAALCAGFCRFGGFGFCAMAVFGFLGLLRSSLCHKNFLLFGICRIEFCSVVGLIVLWRKHTLYILLR